MPQQQNRREARAARKAEQAAQEQARQERIARERKQQTIIGAIVVAVLVVLIAIAGVAVYRSTHHDSSATSSASAQEAHEQMKTLASRPKYANDEGGILVSANGYNKPISNVPTVGVYMDFMCPGCGNLNRTLDKDLVKMVNAGQINLDLYFMSFMDRLSTDEYSTRVATPCCM